jgi:hypothetical protein
MTLYIIMSSNIRSTSTFHNPKYAECIEACNHCAKACEYWGSLCLREENVKMMLKCITFFTVQTFIDLLQNTCPVIVVMQSRFVKHAKVCEVCAKECERHNKDHCKQCSQVCYECAKVCRSI